MTRHRLLVGCAALAATIGAFVISGDAVLAQTPQFREEITVRGTAPQAGTSFYLTFSGPVAVPGSSLEAGTGTYLFQRVARNAIRVTSEDHRTAYTMFLTVPTTRAAISDEHQIVMGESVKPGEPRRMVAWFTPRQRMGDHFIYR